LIIPNRYGDFVAFFGVPKAPALAELDVELEPELVDDDEFESLEPQPAASTPADAIARHAVDHLLQFFTTFPLLRRNPPRPRRGSWP
jgi:hypothetical protein